MKISNDFLDALTGLINDARQESERRRKEIESLKFSIMVRDKLVAHNGTKVDEIKSILKTSNTRKHKLAALRKLMKDYYNG